MGNELINIKVTEHLNVKVECQTFKLPWVCIGKLNDKHSKYSCFEWEMS